MANVKVFVPAHMLLNCIDADANTRAVKLAPRVYLSRLTLKCDEQADGGKDIHTCTDKAEKKNEVICHSEYDSKN